MTGWLLSAHAYEATTGPTGVQHVWYLPKTDQILLNSRNFAEFYFINHKTGEIEYRWGNPSAYGAGKAPAWYDNGDQKVFGTHSPTLLENGNACCLITVQSVRRATVPLLLK